VSQALRQDGIDCGENRVARLMRENELAARRNYDFYGEIIPMRLGMPYAILSNALHFDYSRYTPLCVYDWTHENTPEAIKRNRQGVSKFTQMLIRSNAELIEQAEKAGIKANWEDPSSLFSDHPVSPGI
jgi:hypothetical protein